jgi:hypothetical protein
VVVGAIHGVAAVHRADGGKQVVGSSVLEQEATGSGPERGEGVLVEVERGEHDDPRAQTAGHEASGRLDAVESRHSDVHEDHVGGGRPERSERLAAVTRFADDSHIGLGVDDHRQAGADELLVVDQVHPDHPGLPGC